MIPEQIVGVEVLLLAHVVEAVVGCEGLAQSKSKY